MPPYHPSDIHGLGGWRGSERACKLEGPTGDAGLACSQDAALEDVLSAINDELRVLAAKGKLATMAQAELASQPPSSPAGRGAVFAALEICQAPQVHAT